MKQVAFCGFGFVKNVSSKKAMLCASLRVSKPPGLALPQPPANCDAGDLKRTKEGRVADV